jgi:uncharacterized protein (TIGR03083 family)
MTDDMGWTVVTLEEARDDVGASYRRSRLRLAAVLRGLDAERWSTPVPACPGWRVHDVVSHLVGVIEDAAAGRIQGPPGVDQTAAEVERHRSDPPSALLDQWSATAGPFEAAIAAGGRWPAFLDVLSHEHDIAGALGGHGPRDPDDVDLAARLLSRGLTLGADVSVDLDGSAVAPDGPDRAAVHLRTTPYELFRLRLGRRTRDQVLALDWSSDPGAFLDDLFIFGPASESFPD